VDHLRNVIKLKNFFNSVKDIFLKRITR